MGIVSAHRKIDQSLSSFAKHPFVWRFAIFNVSAAMGMAGHALSHWRNIRRFDRDELARAQFQRGSGAQKIGGKPQVGEPKRGHTYQRKGETRMPLAFEIFVVVTKWVVLVAIAHSLYLTLME
jgi:hypothetical protein